MRAESVAFLEALVNAPSPSGYEGPAVRVFRETTRTYAHRVTGDAHGNTYAVLNPDAHQRIMLAGHIDEIGFQVHYINDDGFIYIQGIGGHDMAVPVGQRVWIHGKEKTPGVIGRTPIHLLESADREKAPKLHDLWIDIGAKNKAEAEAVISLGDPVTYQWEFQRLLGDRVAARGFDNGFGAFVAAEALRLLAEEGGLDSGVGVYAVATVQEEVGLRGARTAAYATEAQSGIAADVNFAIDYPGASKPRYGILDIGKGPSVSRGANTSPVVYEMMMRAAEEDGIPVQVTPEPGGTGTDANAMQISRSGMATGLVGVPLRYMHTPGEVLSLADVENCARLMAAYCRRVRPDTDFTAFA